MKLYLSQRASQCDVILVVFIWNILITLCVCVCVCHECGLDMCKKKIICGAPTSIWQLYAMNEIFTIPAHITFVGRVVFTFSFAIKVISEWHTEKNHYLAHYNLFRFHTIWHLITFYRIDFDVHPPTHIVIQLVECTSSSLCILIYHMAIVPLLQCNISWMEGYVKRKTISNRIK